MQNLLNELYALTQIEYYGGLSKAQSKRYSKIVKKLKSNNVDIPFGIEM